MFFLFLYFVFSFGFVFFKFRVFLKCFLGWGEGFVMVGIVKVKVCLLEFFGIWVFYFSFYFYDFCGFLGG